LRRATRRAMRSGNELVIFDRHIYDELANLNLRNPLIRAYARGLMRIAPRPQVSYLLDAEPEAARARKPEYPLEFLRANRQSYLALNQLVGGLTVIAPMPIEAAKQEVLRHALVMLRASEDESLPGGEPARLKERCSRPAAS
jgi:thymidylate kinase